MSKHISEPIESRFGVLLALGKCLVDPLFAVVVVGALNLTVDQETHDSKQFEHTISYGPFCCKVGQTPKLGGYYAANLISVMPTVRSAKPNAFLFAFKNWTLPRAYRANS